jgi:hypothetical protein
VDHHTRTLLRRRTLRARKPPAAAKIQQTIYVSLSSFLLKEWFRFSPEGVYLLWDYDTTLEYPLDYHLLSDVIRTSYYCTNTGYLANLKVKCATIQKFYNYYRFNVNCFSYSPLRIFNKMDAEALVIQAKLP